MKTKPFCHILLPLSGLGFQSCIQIQIIVFWDVAICMHSTFITLVFGMNLICSQSLVNCRSSLIHVLMILLFQMGAQYKTMFYSKYRTWLFSTQPTSSRHLVDDLHPQSIPYRLGVPSSYKYCKWLYHFTPLARCYPSCMKEIQSPFASSIMQSHGPSVLFSMLHVDTNI